MLTLIILLVILALAYDFVNGMNDAANSIATVVSTRVLSPRLAVLWAAFFNFAAIFIFGTHVADTVGKIVNPELATKLLIFGGLLGAFIWAFTCTHFGLPISISHTLIGGIIGPALYEYGLYENGAIIFNADKLYKVIIFIFLAPVIGMISGYILMVITFWICKNLSPRRVDKYFSVMQLTSSAAFSLGHGGNDAQKVMGIITVLLFSSGYIEKFEVPFWVSSLCYISIALGTLVGGWKVVKTLGVGLTHLKPHGGFCAETAGAITLFGTGFAGIPASTTHTITGAIMGVGITKRFSAVRWGVANHILMAWILTIPMSALLSAFIYMVLKIFI